MQKIQNAKDAVKNKVDAAAGIVPSTITEGAAAAQSAVKAKATDAAAAGMEFGQRKQREMKDNLQKFIKRKINDAISKRLDKMPAFIKKQLSDPDMFECVATGQDYLIDELWKDAKEEIMWEVGMKLDAAKDHDAPHSAQGPDCFRAFWRYHLFPYDRTIWGKLRDPVFILFKLATMIPIMGVAPLAYLFIFIIIDKTDEFQLINFILAFKGMQFITLGVVRVFVGFFVFYGCTIGDDEEHSCDTSGPGTGADFLGTSVGLVICVVLCWVAFLLLPYSKEKGRGMHQGTLHTLNDGSRAAPGGRIRPLLWWDLCSAFFCIGIVGALYAAFGHDETWRLRINMFWAQVIYGIFAFPFFIYTLPLLNILMTHARPTAYDPQGRSVPPKPPAKTLEKEDEDVTDEDVNDLMNLFSKP